MDIQCKEFVYSTIHSFAFIVVVLFIGSSSSENEAEEDTLLSGAASSQVQRDFGLFRNQGSAR